MFLYRPEYYGFEIDEEGNSTQGLCELIIAKNRHGITGSVKTEFVGSKGIFYNWGSNQPTENKIVLPTASNDAPF